MGIEIENGQEAKKRALASTKNILPGTAFGCPRDFLNNRFVYVVMSPRARGLSVGVNMNPDKYCNFDCLYCEVSRQSASRESSLNVETMAAELQHTLSSIGEGVLQQNPRYSALPAELLEMRHVTLSGDGEPTLCPNFTEAVQAVVHVRALGCVPFFKVVLITNATGLDLPTVQEGLKYFTKQDEIWVKLDAGTQAYMNQVNKPQVPLQKVLSNILLLGKQRPVIVQTLFPSVNEQEPPMREVEEYSQRLSELTASGAQISFVQIYSATRPTPNSECGHLSLRTLSNIAQTVRRMTGLRVELF